MGGVDGSMRLLAIAMLALTTTACSVAASPSQTALGTASGVPLEAGPVDGGEPAGARYIDVNASVGDCVGAAETRLAVVEVPTGAAFHELLPGALGTPELDSVDTPVTVVVSRDGWPGPLVGVPGVPRESQKPGIWDVCVRRADGGDIGGLPFIVYGDVPSEGSPILDR